jgi:hypothetical protein
LISLRPEGGRAYWKDGDIKATARRTSGHARAANQLPILRSAAANHRRKLLADLPGVAEAHRGLSLPMNEEMQTAAA